MRDGRRVCPSGFFFFFFFLSSVARPRLLLFDGQTRHAGLGERGLEEGKMMTVSTTGGTGMGGERVYAGYFYIS